MDMNICVRYAETMRKCLPGEEEKLKYNFASLIDEMFGIGTCKLSKIRNQDVIIEDKKMGIYLPVEIKTSGSLGSHIIQTVGYIRDSIVPSKNYGCLRPEGLSVLEINEELLKYVPKISDSAPNKLPQENYELCEQAESDGKVKRIFISNVEPKRFVNEMYRLIKEGCSMKLTKTEPKNISGHFLLLQLCFSSNENDDDIINFLWKYLLGKASIDRETKIGYCDGKEYAMTNYIIPFLNTVRAEDYEDDEIRKLLMCKPRLMEESIRKLWGVYYTHPSLIELADQLKCEVISLDWKLKYRVTDLGAAYGNLTVGKFIPDLVLIEADERAISFIKEFGVNPGCKAIPKDVVRDERVKNRNDKPSIIESNPPEAQQGTKLSGKNKHKEGITETRSAKEMRDKGYAEATLDYFYQFMWEAIMIDEDVGESHICVYANLKFLTSERGKIILDLLKKYRYFFNAGFVFNASIFDDVKGWAMCYVIFSRIPEVWANHTKENRDMEKFELRKVQKDKNGKLSFTLDLHTVYSYDKDKDLAGCCRHVYKSFAKEPQEVVQVRSALNHRGKTSEVPKGCLGEIWSDLDHSASIFSTSFEGRTMMVSENLDYIAILLLAFVKITKSDYLKNGLNIICPTITDKEKFRRLVDDTLMGYFPFSEHSKQSSMRDIEVDGAKYNLINQWYYDSKDNAYQAAIDSNYKDKKDDCTNDMFGDRFHYIECQKRIISDDVLEIIELAREIKRDFTKYETFVKQLMIRTRNKKSHDEAKKQSSQPLLSHNKTWDAAWYQTKNSIDQLAYRKNEKGFEGLCDIILKLEKHSELVKKLEDRLLKEFEEFKVLR